jgi:hypothetical protein
MVRSASWPGWRSSRAECRAGHLGHGDASRAAYRSAVTRLTARAEPELPPGLLGSASPAGVTHGALPCVAVVRGTARRAPAARGCRESRARQRPTGRRLDGGGAPRTWIDLLSRGSSRPSAPVHLFGDARTMARRRCGGSSVPSGRRDPNPGRDPGPWRSTEAAGRRWRQAACSC